MSKESDNKKELYQNEKSSGKHKNPKWKKKNKTQKYNRYLKKKKVPIVYEICPICSIEINEFLVSVVDKKTNKNAHFECIIQEIKKDYPLGEKEKIYYLGGGSFGIVLERKNKNRTSFIVRERIQYHEKSNNRRLGKHP